HRLDAVLQVRLYLVLVAGVGVDDVPLTAFLDRRLFGRFSGAIFLVYGCDLCGGFPFAGHERSYLRRVWSTTQLNPMSTPPSSRPIVNATTTTATVTRIVSSRVGQVTFLSSEKISPKNLRNGRGTGLR